MANIASFMELDQLLQMNLIDSVFYNALVPQIFKTNSMNAPVSLFKVSEFLPKNHQLQMTHYLKEFKSAELVFTYRDDFVQGR